MPLREYIVVDIETTGLSKRIHGITEIAAVYVRDDEVVDTFQSLVNPRVHIPSFITRLTGINDAMVADAPLIQQVLPQFLQFVKDRPFIAHNATFDCGFITENLRRHLASELANEVICTRLLANRLVPQLPSKKLSSLCTYFCVTNMQAHRALADVHATTKIFQCMMPLLEQKGVVTPQQLLKFQRSPCR